MIRLQNPTHNLHLKEKDFYTKDTSGFLVKLISKYFLSTHSNGGDRRAPLLDVKPEQDTHGSVLWGRGIGG